MKKIRFKKLILLTLAVLFTIPFFGSINEVKAYEYGNKVFGRTRLVESGGSGEYTLEFETDLGWSGDIYNIYNNWQAHYGTKTNIYYLIAMDVSFMASPQVAVANGSILEFVPTDIIILTNNFQVITTIVSSNIENGDFFLQLFDYTIMDAFENGFNTGKNAGYTIGFDEGKEEYGIFFNNIWMDAIDFGLIRYDDAKEEYGIYYNDTWMTATQYGNIRYNEGLETSGPDQFEAGYIKGSQDSFIAGIEKWIVPAIITVILGGGVISFIMIRGRRE